MRLLTYNVPKKIIKRLEEESLYIIDQTTQLDDALYHLQVRFYNLVLLYEDNKYNCMELLSTQKESLSTAFVVVSKNITKEFEISCLKSGALFVLEDTVCIDLLMTKIESIHRDIFSKKFKYSNLFFLDNENQQIKDNENNDLAIRGKAFNVLSYLVQNKYRSPISKDEMICAIWEDPELVSQNVIEVNINQIRKELKKRFGQNLIDTVRNRGYRIAAHLEYEKDNNICIKE